MAPELEVGVLGAVGFERSSRAVKRPAVELDHHLLRAPQRVDLVTLHEHIELGPQDAVVVAEVEQVALPVGVDDAAVRL